MLVKSETVLSSVLFTVLEVCVVRYHSLSFHRRFVRSRRSNQARGGGGVGGEGCYTMMPNMQTCE